MNKSDEIKQRIEKIIGKIEEDIGYSGETEGHFHIYQIDSGGQGIGRTIGTKQTLPDGSEVNSLSNHTHHILNFEMSLVDNHSHSLT